MQPYQVYRPVSGISDELLRLAWNGAEPGPRGYELEGVLYTPDWQEGLIQMSKLGAT